MNAGARRVVLRSRHQLVTGVGFGALIVVLGVFAAIQTEGVLARLIVGGVGLAAGGSMAMRFVRAKIIVDDEGVTIVNFRRTTKIGWTEIRRFRIGRHRLLSAVAMVDLVDGTSHHAEGVQRPQVRRPLGRTREGEMIDFLNTTAAAHGAPVDTEHDGPDW